MFLTGPKTKDTTIVDDCIAIMERGTAAGRKINQNQRTALMRLGMAHYSRMRSVDFYYSDSGEGIATFTYA